MEKEDLRKILIEKAKMGIKEAYSSEEYVLMQAINAYLELTKVYNLINERMEEWSGIYIPDVKIGSPVILANIIIAISKEKPDNDAIIRAMGSPDKGNRVIESVSNGIGRKIVEGEETDVIKNFAEHSLATLKLIEMLENYIKSASNRMMPNLSYLTDEKIAAEMLSKAGSMERLATFPASTLQLLGAEKALFKHIKYGSRPPKYGILFKLPAVTNAPKQLKGKVARAYAAKLAIALKGDFFSKRFIADQLKTDLEESIKKMKETKPKEIGRGEGYDKYQERPNQGARRFGSIRYNRNQGNERNDNKHQRVTERDRYLIHQTKPRNQETWHGEKYQTGKDTKHGERYQERPNKDANYRGYRSNDTQNDDKYKEQGRKRYNENRNENDKTRHNAWNDRKRNLGKRRNRKGNK